MGSQCGICIMVPVACGGRAAIQRPIPTRAGSKTVTAASFRAWTAVRTCPKLCALLPSACQKHSSMKAVAGTAASSSLVHSGALSLWQGHNGLRQLKFLLSCRYSHLRDITLLQCFPFSRSNSAYLCPDPYLNPVSYHIPSLSSTEASVFRLIPLHSALHGEHFIFIGQYLGPLVLERGCLSWYENCVVLLKQSTAYYAKCSVSVLSLLHKLTYTAFSQAWYGD